MNATAEQIQDALPQTQCTRCGYPDCAGYAHAIAAGEARIDRCPPGGDEGVSRLARLTGQAPAGRVDPAYGAEGPRMLAVIDEAWCIGCTRCLDVCPTDAIVGMHKRMHTVIEAHCTGCELCIPVCPVDCIELETATPGLGGWQAWSPAQADHARSRYDLHRRRLASPAATASASRADVGATEPPEDAAARKQAIVKAALARARIANALPIPEPGEKQP